MTTPAIELSLDHEPCVRSYVHCIMICSIVDANICRSIASCRQCVCVCASQALAPCDMFWNVQNAVTCVLSCKLVKHVQELSWYRMSSLCLVNKQAHTDRHCLLQLMDLNDVSICRLLAIVDIACVCVCFMSYCTILHGLQFAGCSDLCAVMQACWACAKPVTCSILHILDTLCSTISATWHRMKRLNTDTLLSYKPNVMWLLSKSPDITPCCIIGNVQTAVPCVP